MTTSIFRTPVLKIWQYETLRPNMIATDLLNHTAISHHKKSTKRISGFLYEKDNRLYYLTLSLTNNQICLASCQNKFAILVHFLFFVLDVKRSAGEQQTYWILWVKMQQHKNDVRQAKG